MKIKFFVFFWLVTGFLSAHVHWVDVDPANPVDGKTVKIKICSGHEFPESGFAVSPRLIHRVFVTGPDTDDSVVTSPEKRCHSGMYEFKKPGIYRVGFILKKPQMDTPVFYSGRLVRVGDFNGDDEYPVAGKGLQIVPLPGLFTRKKGQSATVKVVRDGNPVQTTCEITVNGRKPAFIKSDTSGQISFPVTRYGEYLIIASDGGVGSTLTFVINPDKVGN